jgi:hypothetical protein
MLLDKPLPSGVAAQNYRSILAGKRGCIMTNSGGQAADVRLREFAGDAGKKCKMYIPGRAPQVVGLPTTITIAPERLAMIAQAGEAK